MESKKSEQVIYLKDLFFSVLYRWKGILVTALALAIVLAMSRGVFDFIKIKTATEESVAAEHLLLEQYEAQKDALELKISALQDSIKNQNAYLDESLCMELDPYEFYQATITVYVDTGYQIIPELSYQNPDKTAAVVAAYQTVLNGNDMLVVVAEALGSHPIYLREVYSCGISSASTLVLTLNAKDEASALKTTELLLEQITANQEQIGQNVAAHTVHILEQSISLKQDLDIAARQRTETDRMTQLLTDLIAAELSLESLRVPEITENISVFKNAVKYGIIGGMIGVFLSVIYLLIAGILDGRVYSVKALKSRTGINVLCSVSASDKKGIDCWLRRLEGRSNAAAEPQAALIAATVRNLYSNISQLSIAGDVADENRQCFVAALREALPGVQVIDEGSVQTQANALTMLASSDAVLLIAECGASRYDTLCNETDVVTRHNKPIMGCVLLNG